MSDLDLNRLRYKEVQVSPKTGCYLSEFPGWKICCVCELRKKICNNYYQYAPGILHVIKADLIEAVNFIKAKFNRKLKTEPAVGEILSDNSGPSILPGPGLPSEITEFIDIAVNAMKYRRGMEETNIVSCNGCRNAKAGYISVDSDNFKLLYPECPGKATEGGCHGYEAECDCPDCQKRDREEKAIEDARNTPLRITGHKIEEQNNLIN